METSVLVLRITRNLKTWVAIRAITLPNYNKVVINYSINYGHHPQPHRAVERFFMESETYDRL